MNLHHMVDIIWMSTSQVKCLTLVRRAKSTFVQYLPRRLTSDVQHQRWAASGEQQAASGGSGWQQGGSMVETLPDHGRCCFVVLLGWQSLTDGVCGDVFDVAEGIAGATVIVLIQEEKGIRERYGSDKKMYT